MALYKDGNPVSGLNSIPRLTLAQYNALNVKPEFWVRTDAPESYKKLSADQVSYNINGSVKGELDSFAYSDVHNLGMPTSPIVVSNEQKQIGETVSQYFPIGKYIVFGALNASWDIGSGNMRILIDVDGTQCQADSEARVKTNALCFFSAGFTLQSTGTHTIKLIVESPNAQKPVTITDFQEIHLNIIKVW